MTSSGAPADRRDRGAGRVMAAVDGEGPDRRLVIADTGADDAWLSAALGDAHPLPEWV